MRRKSALPSEYQIHEANGVCNNDVMQVDPTVLRDLQAHRSLDDASTSGLRPASEGPV
jgi:hypothetical protein